jgi:hypothetical protein
MLLRKGVKNANLNALRDPQFCHCKVAPLRRTWVAPLGRSSTLKEYSNPLIYTERLKSLRINTQRITGLTDSL